MIEEIDQQEPILIKDQSDASNIAIDQKHEEMAQAECGRTQLPVDRHSSNFKKLNQALEEFQILFEASYTVRWRDHSGEKGFAELSIPYA
jgi:hypothetical protein